MGGGATLLVADAGWTTEQRDAIVQGARDRGINLLWFSSTFALTYYINEGRDRTEDPITSIYVFAHGTDNGTGQYALTLGLYLSLIHIFLSAWSAGETESLPRQRWLTTSYHTVGTSI